MQVHWAYFECSKDEEEQLQRSWEEWQRQLLARLAVLPDAPAELELVATREDEGSAWRLQAALHLWAEALVVEVVGESPSEAIEALISRLIAEVDRVERRPERVTLRREGLEGLLPILERCRRLGRSGAFLSWLTPVVASLVPHVRRELRIRELESQLASGQVAPLDVCDEVLVRAYERFDRRPDKMSLDLWLLGLAEEVCAQWSGRLAEKSLDEPVDKPSEELRASRRDEWVEWATVSETNALSEALPGMPSPDSWDTLDMEAKQAPIDTVLARLPRLQRQAMVLTTVYGFSPREVADFQGRGEEDVLAEIDEGRRAVEHNLRHEYLSEQEEKLEPQPRRASRKGNP